MIDSGEEYELSARRLQATYGAAIQSMVKGIMEAQDVAKEMRDWMKDHRWLKELDDWATRLETL